MPRPRTAFRYTALFSLAVFLFSGRSFPVYAQLERQSITGGGTVTGSLVNPEAGPDEDYRIAFSETDSVSLTHSAIRKKEILRPEVVQYRLNAPLSEDTIESHRNWASYCRENSMPAEMRLHLERILELDPEDAAARKALGYEKREGVWMTAKEKRERNGYVVYGGKSVTPQEAELYRQQDEIKKRTGSWKKEFRAIRAGLSDGDPGAKERLLQITEPEALSVITDAVKKDENPQIRVLYVLAISKIGTPAALRDLADIFLADEDGEVRQTAIEQIEQHTDAIPGAVEYFRSVLRTPGKYENYAVNRAGYALGFLDAESALGDLINALVTRHTKTIVINATPTEATFSSNGDISFNPGTSEKTQNVTTEFENGDVLAALRKIASERAGVPIDFGYDIGVWKDWLIQKENLANFRSRRDD